jgi:hypothetical protein
VRRPGKGLLVVHAAIVPHKRKWRTFRPATSCLATTMLRNQA